MTADNFAELVERLENEIVKYEDYDRENKVLHTENNGDFKVEFVPTSEIKPDSAFTKLWKRDHERKIVLGNCDRTKKIIRIYRDGMRIDTFLHEAGHAKDKTNYTLLKPLAGYLVSHAATIWGMKAFNDYLYSNKIPFFQTLNSIHPVLASIVGIAMISIPPLYIMKKICDRNESNWERKADDYAIIKTFDNLGR